MRRHPFLISLCITAITWLLFTMSEHSDYPLELRVEWSGYDSARYAVVYADSVLPLMVNSDCFQAIDRHFSARNKSLVINVQGDTVIKVNSDLFSLISNQLMFKGSVSIRSKVDTIAFHVTERSSRAFVPQLRNVQFNFAPQYGLSGLPVMSPDTVWLYGDSLSLSKISDIFTAPDTINNIADSMSVALRLEPNWKDYRDIRSSAELVHIYLPVQRMAQLTLRVPVAFHGELGSRKVKLYPDHVNVTLWVPQQEYDNITSEHLHAVVEYDAATSSYELPVAVKNFPSCARIKQITPSTVQYVILQ